MVSGAPLHETLFKTKTNKPKQGQRDLVVCGHCMVSGTPLCGKPFKTKTNEPKQRERDQVVSGNCMVILQGHLVVGLIS